MVRKKENNRKIITTSPNRRPYGAKLTLLLEDHMNFKIDGECSLIVSPEVILEIKLADKRPYIKGSCWDICVYGFATAGEAENFGLKVALGFLWVAVKSQYSARLIYHTPLPCAIYDRTKSVGMTVSAFATVSMAYSIKNVVEPLDEIISSNKTLDQRLLVAVEIFTSAKLETTERSKFVGLVSAVEPLAKQEKYKDPELETLITDFKSQIELSSLDQPLKDSLKGRIDQLRIESVSRAIRRLVKDKLPGDKESLEIIEEAYGLRSKILHEGATDADLQQKSHEVEQVIKVLIEKYIDDFINSE